MHNLTSSPKEHTRPDNFMQSLDYFSYKMSCPGSNTSQCKRQTKKEKKHLKEARAGVAGGHHLTLSPALLMETRVTGLPQRQAVTATHDPALSCPPRLSSWAAPEGFQPTLRGPTGAWGQPRSPWGRTVEPAGRCLRQESRDLGPGNTVHNPAHPPRAPSLTRTGPRLPPAWRRASRLLAQWFGNQRYSWGHEGAGQPVASSHANASSWDPPPPLRQVAPPAWNVGWSGEHGWRRGCTFPNGRWAV